MRKIDLLTRNAFHSGFEWKLDNTQVRVEGGLVFLFLHGNLIARRNENSNQFEISNAGWSSNTTKSRLNALDGVSISQKNWEWFLNGEKWDGSWILIGGDK